MRTISQAMLQGIREGVVKASTEGGWINVAAISKQIQHDFRTENVALEDIEKAVFAQVRLTGRPIMFQEPPLAPELERSSEA
ncbi:hypothetical protein [Aminobacter sp. MET-1]|uniref:hypothetical protein n=1 Tax=Aminobacter sp. MET-1 TaxID=2951085 RepID=UPI00226A6D4A|nr:hypothetical protein [Aminobacter sp. MET-1]MCX8570796.1 hypothetical protein [Aminobacter sp. MET-1]